MSVDVQQFKNALAHWASGVTVVTTQLDGHPIGITASSFTSLSLQPPQVLISVSRKLHTHDAILQSRVFAVSILSTEQLAWGMRFAGMMPEVGDRFEGITWSTAITGCAILPGVLGWVDCSLRHAYDGEDHSIFIGEVVAAGFRDNKTPLLYFDRRWRQLAEGVLELAERPVAP